MTLHFSSLLAYLNTTYIQPYAQDEDENIDYDICQLWLDWCREYFEASRFEESYFDPLVCIPAKKVRFCYLDDNWRWCCGIKNNFYFRNMEDFLAFKMACL